MSGVLLALAASFIAGVLLNDLTQNSSEVSADAHSDASGPDREDAELDAEAAHQQQVWSNTESEIEALRSQTRVAAVLTDIETGERLVDVGGSERFEAASMYKVHTAISMYRHLEDGNLSEESWVGGVPVDTCIELIIVQSENECAEAWFNTIGWDTFEAEARELGADQAQYEPWDVQLAPNDVVTALEQLYREELLATEDTSELLTYMQGQVWRDGIPSVFEPEWQVANKVGFLPTVHHDGAIITGQERAFALVVFTEWQDYEYVNEAAHLVKQALDTLEID